MLSEYGPAIHFLCHLQRSEQYRTSSQQRCHFLRHANGLQQVAQSLTGSSLFFIWCLQQFLRNGVQNGSPLPSPFQDAQNANSDETTKLGQ
jgi:hypothetical protein